MAKTNTPTRESSPKTAAALIPKPTDARSELFWLLGRIEGQGVEGSARIVSLVIELLERVQPIIEEREASLNDN